jgi:hypothetical protein
MITILEGGISMKFTRTVSLLLALLLAAPALGGELNRPAEEGSSMRDNMLRSALLPGLGQMEQGRVGRGVTWAGGAVFCR